MTTQTMGILWAMAIISYLATGLVIAMISFNLWNYAMFKQDVLHVKPWHYIFFPGMLIKKRIISISRYIPDPRPANNMGIAPYIIATTPFWPLRVIWLFICLIIWPLARIFRKPRPRVSTSYAP
ncbi:MAG TPA: hypothetical protein VMX18_00860 [Candidatus Bipolaricaulota bacterium]|nr:hypothetical protein [Candidatus Bipolaricaulota bacterium]